MEELQIIAFLVLLVFQVESQATTHQCDTSRTSFPSCSNNSVLQITKSTEMYQVTLLATELQCYNDFCLINSQRYRQRNITCNEICIACRQLQPPERNYGCDGDPIICETWVDRELDEFCALATTTRNSATTCNITTIIEKLPCPTNTITNTHTVQPTTVTVSVSPTHSSTLPHQRNEAKPTTSSTTPQMSTCTTSYCRQDQTPIKSDSMKTGESILALIGALLGLSVVLLAVVTTGWVCTCIHMKSKMATNQSQQTSVTHNIMATASTTEDGDKLQCSNNPSYEVMKLHRPIPSQTGSDERDIVSDTYASVQ